LRQSIKQAEEGKIVAHDLIEEPPQDKETT